MVDKLDKTAQLGDYVFVLSSVEFWLIVIAIFGVMFYIFYLLIKKNEIYKVSVLHKEVYESILSQRNRLESENKTLREGKELLISSHKEEIDKLNCHIVKIESENFILLRENYNFQKMELSLEKSKSNFLGDMVIRYFGEKTKTFIEMIDSNKVEDSDKIVLFKEFFAEVIPIIKSYEPKNKKEGGLIITLFIHFQILYLLTHLFVDQLILHYLILLF